MEEDWKGQNEEEALCFCCYRSSVLTPLTIFGILSLFIGIAGMIEGISLSQKEKTLYSLTFVFANGIEFYFIVFFMLCYLLLMLANIIRKSRVFLVEIAAVWGMICLFLCGGVFFFATWVPFVAWEENENKNEMCSQNVRYGVFCDGLQWIQIGALSFLLGTLVLQPLQLFHLHLTLPLSDGQQPELGEEGEEEREGEVERRGGE
mmetsp:Transcript_23836/g.32533  ORF Transcript_23836/g.32533 Transcript_23836/m.32533 type:complete len:205 (+) Transcript_23836:1305-1919(+)